MRAKQEGGLGSAGGGRGLWEERQQLGQGHVVILLVGTLSGPARTKELDRVACRYRGAGCLWTLMRGG